MTDQPSRERGSRPLPRLRRPASSFLLAILLGALAPAGATAQFGPIEALASRVSDLSFYFATGGLTGSSQLESNQFGVRSFGVELLFEVAQVPSAEARRRRAATPATTREVLQRIEVRHVEGRADTIYHYAVERAPPPGYGPADILWTMEVGYLGLRTGFMRTDALQVVDTGGNVYRGRAEAFIMGALVGYAFPVPPAFLFVEGGHTLRAFPSVEWTSTPGPLPPGVPRTLDVSGWTVAVGIQFPVR